MTDTEACYREPTNGVYFTRKTHRNDCTDPECRGCRPCSAPDHCTAKRSCSWHVAERELTCGRCLAEVRFNLRWIGDLAPLLPHVAFADGRLDSEAANLAGPSVDAEAWSWHKVARLKSGTSVDQLEDDDEHHPHRVIGTWARMISEDYGHDMPEQATLAWCIKYLDRQLHTIANDEHQDFLLMAAELKKCRQHVEATLSTAKRTEHGADCPECVDAIRQIRDELVANKVPENEWPKLKAPRLVRHYGHWCEDESCEKIHYSTRFDADACVDVPDTSGDVWICPRNRDHAWTHEAYSNWIEERRSGQSA